MKSKEKNKKNVIVTGGTRGMGRAIVEVLLKEGYAVYTCAREVKELKKVEKELSVLGKLHTFVLDLTDRKAIMRFAKHWTKPLYGIIHNAGTWGEEALADKETGLFDYLNKLNYEAVYYLTKWFYPHLVDGGRIVVTSSQLGTSGRSRMAQYSATKHAVIGLVRSWAWELGPRQITVNAVGPGWVDTESNMKEIAALAKKEGKTLEARLREISETLALKRFVKQEEVANLVAFLVSEKGSGITGQVYEIK